MAFTFTGISYFVGAIATGAAVWRVYRYYTKEPGTTSRMFFWFGFFFFLFFATTAAVSLFFSEYPFILWLNVIMATLLQGIACAFLGYLLFYLIRDTVWVALVGAAIVLLLTAAAIVFLLLIPYAPSLSEDGLSIQWDVPLIAGLLRIAYFGFAFVPLVIIMLVKAALTSDPAAKTRALGLGITLLFGIVMASTDFFQRALTISRIWSEVALMIEFFLIFLLLALPTGTWVSRYFGRHQQQQEAHLRDSVHKIQ